MRNLFLLALLAGCPKPTAPEAPTPEPAVAPAEPAQVIGDWIGSLEIPGGGLRLALHVTEAEGGLAATLDSPDQGGFGIPASAVDLAGDTLTVTVDSLGAKLITKVGETLDGTFHQGGGILPISLSRGTYDAPARPQEPALPLPYAEEPVVIDAGGHTLAGTLTLPEGEGPFPAVALITGSGPQDRDEALMGHRPFYVLADRLTRAGIAVLRTDDRGVASSTGDFPGATTLDFADDARAALVWLDERAETSEVGLLGHSEGGMVAPLAADAGADFLVLLAPPAVPIIDLMLRQQEDVALSMGVPEAQATARREERRRSLELIARNDDPDAVAELRELIAASPEVQGLPESQVEEGLQTVLTPWWRVFAGYEPATQLGQIEVPTFAAWGSLDVQVAAEPNLAATEQSVPEEHLQAKVYEGLNHLFQPASTGAVGEYATIEITMSDEVMTDIATFIHEAVSPGD